MTRVLLADDHAIIRDGVKQILADTDDLVVAGEAANGQVLLKLVAEQPWDIVVLDISMPGKNGLELIKLIRQDHPRLPILIFSMHQEEQYALRALHAGASGYAPSRVQSTANTNDFSLPVHKTKENTALIEYRNTVVQDLTGRLAYSYSSRKAGDYSAPVFAATTNTATLLSNAYYQNFRDYFVADRKRDKLRGALNYQASEAWSLGASLDFNKDAYTNSALTEAKSTVLNLDASFTPMETLTINPYYSYEDRKSSLTGKYIINTAVAGATLNGVSAAAQVNGGVACNTANRPCILANWGWGLDQADKVSTLGIATRYSGLISGRLDLKGDLLFVHAKTPVTASGGGSVISDGAAVPNFVSIPVLNFPDITSKTLQFRLTGKYKLDKAQSVQMGYMYQRLQSTDWQYDAYSNPVAMQAMIGTGITSPNYRVHVVGASYIYSFQ